MFKMIIGFLFIANLVSIGIYLWRNSVTKQKISALKSLLWGLLVSTITVSIISLFVFLF